MNNQDMTVNTHPAIYNSDNKVVSKPSTGETKREKAFWLMFSVALTSSTGSLDEKANDALEAVNAGFKALEAKD